MSEDKALDLIGIKGLSDSVRIATKGVLDGAAAFLSRVCLPAAEEFGLALRDRVSAWRAKNLARMLSAANQLDLANNPGSTDQLSPRLAALGMEEASWTDNDEIQAMWSGLLASSISPGGQSDENLVFMNILRQLSSLQVRVLRFAVENAAKFASPQGLPFPKDLPVSLAELPELFGTQDLQRLDREFDHLRELGLIGFGLSGGGISPEGSYVDLTPTPLAMHLYVRAQGSRLSPAQYWDLKAEPSSDDTPAV